MQVVCRSLFEWNWRSVVIYCKTILRRETAHVLFRKVRNLFLGLSMTFYLLLAQVPALNIPYPAHLN